MKAALAVSDLIAALSDLPPDLPVVLEGGFGPQLARGQVFEARRMSEDRVEGSSLRPGEGPDGLRAVVIA